MAEDTRDHAHPRYAKERGRPEKGSTFELYLAASPCPPEQPVVVFHHLQKTAGTSLRRIIYRNYLRAGARHFVMGAPRKYDPDKMREWTKNFYASLSEAERQSIVCIAAHGANHITRYLKRPTVAITLLRDPVERVLSRYYFGSAPSIDLATFYAELEQPRIENKLQHLRQFCNAQSRSLLEPLTGVDFPELGWSRGAPADAALWRERLFSLLADRYVIGLQDRFEESVRYFGRLFGWNDLFFPHAKRNETRPREVSEDLRAEILAHNWLDESLYRYFAMRPIGVTS